MLVVVVAWRRALGGLDALHPFAERDELLNCMARRIEILEHHGLLPTLWHPELEEIDELVVVELLAGVTPAESAGNEGK